MGDTCKCGHVAFVHLVDPPHGCVEHRCSCDSFAAPAPVESAWLDAPDGDGWWWRAWVGDPASLMAVQYRVLTATWFEPGSDGLRGRWVGRQPGQYERWMRMPMPAPPPKPLPRSRTVELTARVEGVNVHIEIAGKPNNLGGWPTSAGAIKWVRDNYGIEPEVVES